MEVELNGNAPSVGAWPGDGKNPDAVHVSEEAAFGGRRSERRGEAVVEAPSTVGECFEIWGREVWRLLSIIGVPEREVPDATHDVFLTAHRRWHDFRGGSSRRTWIIGIALNVARNYRRRHGRAAEDAALNGLDADQVGQNESGTPDPFEETARAESLSLLKRLLARRSEVERQLLVLCLMQEMSVVEAASLLGLPESGARYALSRAKRCLSADLERHRAQDERRVR